MLRPELLSCFKISELFDSSVPPLPPNVEVADLAIVGGRSQGKRLQRGGYSTDSSQASYDGHVSRQWQIRKGVLGKKWSWNGAFAVEGLANSLSGEMSAKSVLIEQMYVTVSRSVEQETDWA